MPDTHQETALKPLAEALRSHLEQTPEASFHDLECNALPCLVIVDATIAGTELATAWLEKHSGLCRPFSHSRDRGSNQQRIWFFWSPFQRGQSTHRRYLSDAKERIQQQFSN